jgi:hypothetical protein
VHPLSERTATFTIQVVEYLSVTDLEQIYSIASDHCLLVSASRTLVARLSPSPWPSAFSLQPSAFNYSDRLIRQRQHQSVREL